MEGSSDTRQGWSWAVFASRVKKYRETRRGSLGEEEKIDGPVGVGRGRTTVTGAATGTTFSSLESTSFAFSQITRTSSSEMITPLSSCSICEGKGGDGRPSASVLGA